MTDKLLLKKLNIIRNKLKKNDPSIGSWLQLGNENSAQILSKSGSFDWICIDLEHSAISLETCENLIRSIENSNTLPIVRLSSNDEVQIKRVLDSGALGIIVPSVKNLSQIKHAHNSINYPPFGKRGVGLARAQNWGKTFEFYKDKIAKKILLIAQIENKEGVENIDEIFESGLIDAYFIGPYDLSSSLGSPGNFKSIKFVKALKKVKDSAKRNNIPSGFHLIEPNKSELKKLLSEGYLFIAYSMDSIMLREASKIYDK